METHLRRHWWKTLLGGILVVAFGVITLLRPGAAISALLIMFGVFAVAVGIFTIVASIAHRKEYTRWWLALIGGILGIAIGVISFGRPFLTGLFLLYLIGSWAFVTGILSIVVSIRMRKIVKGGWMLTVSGILSVVFSIFILIFPGLAAISMIWVVGVYAVMYGVLLIIHSFQAKR
jgi:uncharacterized membrane protein HdeD (DUF308 family)